MKKCRAAAPGGRRGGPRRYIEISQLQAAFFVAALC